MRIAAQPPEEVLHVVQQEEDALAGGVADVEEEVRGGDAGADGSGLDA